MQEAIEYLMKQWMAKQLRYLANKLDPPPVAQRNPALPPGWRVV